MLEHQTDLLNLEVSDVELRQILHEIGDMELGGSDAVRVGDIVEATQCDPSVVAEILSRLRGKDVLAELKEQSVNHELRIRNLELWKERADALFKAKKDSDRNAEKRTESNAPRSHPPVLKELDDGSVFDFNTGKWHQYSLDFDRSTQDSGSWHKPMQFHEYFIVAAFVALIVYIAGLWLLR